MINGISPFQIQTPAALQGQSSGAVQQQGKSGFGEMLKEAIMDVNDAQIQSGNMTEALAQGKNVELQDVMITAEKANVSLMSAVELRNKAVEAYQEIMRMQM
ncbi:flagellar hook-basal body complex protein FliE [Metabacillus sp. RGM 3146]|uniref:flagellar hook-basal body complex protein FliE n=1 Tax=Metabacillus sp. RGM 3146 TaxID=3401092 RepID=UPI003B9D732F